MRSIRAFLGAFLIVAPALPLAAQMPPLPSDPGLQEAYFAWDRGAYDEALTGYLEALTGPGGAGHLEEIALLSGELFQVEEVAWDGRANLRVAANSAYALYEAREAGEAVTRVVDLRAGGAPVLTLPGVGATFAGADHVAYLVIGETVEDRRVRVRALPSGPERTIDLRGWLPRGPTNSVAGVLVGSPDQDTFYALASRESEQRPTDILRIVASSGTLTVLPAGEGGKSGILPAPGGRHLVFTSSSGTGGGGGDATLVVLDLATRASTLYPGRSGAAVSADGSFLAFVGREGSDYTVEVLPLDPAGLPEPALVLRTSMEVSTPALSPSGRTVAFQARPVHDWEIFASPAVADGEIRQLTKEIQHDLGPRFVDEETILALKGEARHRRSYLYDATTGTQTKLFHNNTVRTIAPEYEWQIVPDGSRILIIADRDGDTISPERGVYLVHLDRTATLRAVRTRLEENLAREKDLRARGTRSFAPITDEVALVTGQVSVERIYQHARELYRMDSKYITQPGNLLAIAYLEAQLRGWGYEPELQWFEPREGIRTANVIARLPGTVDPGLVYVASSHFDSVERGPGADDNSSGMTALLEAARVMRDHPRSATIEFAFFTGEEAGLLGSREYVRRAVEGGKQIVGALNNDMIGWANDHRLDNTIRYSNPGIRDIQHAAAILFSDLITYDALYYRSTDAAAYYEAYGDIVGGIGSYPVLGNPHYHQFTDRLETVNQRLVAEVSRVTVGTLMLLASSPSRLAGLESTPAGARQPSAIVLSWDPAPETGVSRYTVRYDSAAGVEVEREVAWTPGSGSRRPSVLLEGVRPGSVLAVKAVSERGLEGWDWARLTVEQ